MKAMILAAGRGERMRPLTDKIPKPLLRAGDHMLIEYHIRALVSAGIDELVINTAHLGSQIEAVLGDGRQWHARISYSRETTALETAGGIRQALHLLGSEPFYVINGDVWTDYRFSCADLPPGQLAHLVMVDNPAHHPEGDFVLKHGLLSEDGNERLTFSGIGIYHPEIFSALEPGRMPLAPVLKNAMRCGVVGGEHFRGHWLDIGTPQRLADLDSMLR